MHKILLLSLMLGLAACTPPDEMPDRSNRPVPTASPEVAAVNAANALIGMDKAIAAASAGNATGNGAAAPAQVATAMQNVAQMGKPDMSLPVVDVFKSTSCGCCAKWIDHLKANGFRVNVVNLDADMPAKKTALGVPDDARSCHTGVVNGYFVEGHVPASDIKKLLAEKPKNVKGLAVPGMPMGSPGMEMPGAPAEDYITFAINQKGEKKTFVPHAN